MGVELVGWGDLVLFETVICVEIKAKGIPFFMPDTWQLLRVFF
jgi:hypothetical protein